MIEDQFDQAFVQEMVDILLAKLCFRSLAIQKGSVCAAIGAGLTDCCVVDLGYSRTSVSCVEEANVSATTIFPFGGLDLSEFLVHMLAEYAPTHLSHGFLRDFPGF